MPLLTLLQEQRDFSVSAFGPSPRLHGVLEHLKKELAEAQESPGDVTEWADCFLLCVDGALRAGGDPLHIDAYMSHGIMPEESKVQDGWSFDDIHFELSALEGKIHQWRPWAVMAYRIWLAAYHHGHQGLIPAVAAKLAINKSRTWPDWRKVAIDQAIEHIKD